MRSRRTKKQNIPLIAVVAVVLLLNGIFIWQVIHFLSSFSTQLYTLAPGYNRSDTVPSIGAIRKNPKLPADKYVVTGKPTIDAKFINGVFKHYDSPAQGKGQALYDYGVHYGIDPAYALAFFLQESNFGTQGVATVTHSLGNIRATDGYAQYKGYRQYATWEAGFEDWYRLIATTYVEQWGLATVKQIIPTYAPASDLNDETAYIRTVEVAVDTWREGTIMV